MNFQLCLVAICSVLVFFGVSSTLNDGPGDGDDFVDGDDDGDGDGGSDSDGDGDDDGDDDCDGDGDGDGDGAGDSVSLWSILLINDTCKIKPTCGTLRIYSRSKGEELERAVHEVGCTRFVVDGGVLIEDHGSHAQGLQYLQGLVEVHGSLKIQFTSLSSLVGLESLTLVNDSFEIDFNKVLSNITLPNLHKTGHLTIQVNHMLAEVSLPKLAFASGIAIIANTRLARLNLRGMEELATWEATVVMNSWLCISDPNFVQSGIPDLFKVDLHQPCGCPPGFYVDEKQCAICPMRFYCTGARGGKTPCASMMTSRPSSSRIDDCTCLPGKVSHIVVDGTIQCLTCETGSIAGPDSNKCVCDVGFEPGAGTCTRCGILKRKDGYGDEYCEINASLLVVVVIGVAAVVLAACLLSGWLLRKKQAQLIQSALRKERKQEKIKAGLNAMSTLDFPMVVMRADTFLGLGHLIPHETAIAKDTLLWLSTVEEINALVSRQKIVFFSHQWLGFREPDPHNAHYDCMVRALGNIADRRGWSLLDMYVWVDYISIPQAVRYTQLGAIHSLPIYASLASAFVIVAPCTSHADLDIESNLSTYAMRTWCRLECVSHYCCLGAEDMFFTTDTGIEKVNEDFLEDVLLVFGGQCTCCRLQHKGIVFCDKELLVIPVLALYTKVCMEKDKSEASRRVYNFIEKHRDQMFPKTFTAEFMPEMDEAQMASVKSASMTGLIGPLNFLFEYPKHLFHGKSLDAVDPKADVRVEERELFGTILDDLPEVVGKMKLIPKAEEFTSLQTVSP